MWAGVRVQGLHESERCFSAVNLPVTWLPLSTGSACEWRIHVCVSAREAASLSNAQCAHTHTHAGTFGHHKQLRYC